MRIRQIALGFAVGVLAVGATTVVAHTPCDTDCEGEAVALFEACLDALGPDATDADEDACRDEARALRDACRDTCPDDNPDDGDECRDQCEESTGWMWTLCCASAARSASPKAPWIPFSKVAPGTPSIWSLLMNTRKNTGLSLIKSKESFCSRQRIRLGTAGRRDGGRRRPFPIISSII